MTIDADLNQAAEGQRTADTAAIEAIGVALEEALRPVALQPLPWRVVDALSALEEADDWRWVQT